MLTTLIKYCSSFLLLFIILSCNAPRNNPLDPQNPDNNIGIIEGYIKTTKVPQLPIENCKIFWVNEGIITNSNKDGFFRIEHVKKKNGWLLIEKENYSTDSLLITFNNQNKILQTIFLNSIPRMNDLKFYSITINRFPSNQKYNLEIETNITDEENDIDSVFIENIELNTNKKLLYNPSTKYYANSIYLEDLNITSIDAVIGKEFYINVFDFEGKKIVIGKSNIKRIIKKEIETTAPSGRDTVDTSNPLLEWRRFEPGFEFKYLLEIKTDERPAILVWQKEISSNEIQYLTDANLSSGDYFWVIWAIDEFGNRTRSKEASFIIK